MAVTSVIQLQEAQDGTRTVLANITLDASYAAGGEPVTANQVGLSRIVNAIVSPAFGAGPIGYVGAWDNTNLKLIAFIETGNAGALGEGSGDLSAITFSVLFFGV